MIANRFYSSICWIGSIVGKAQENISECEKAVELASPKDKGLYQYGRGVARAITGNIEGAIADFQSFLKWSDTNNIYNDSDRAKLNAKRQRWIKELQAGRPPSAIFTKEVLEELWDE